MHTKRILIIDDEPQIVALIKSILEHHPDDRFAFKGMMAASGPDGLECVIRDTPDLVLLDMRMPEWDGLETLKRIKSVAPDMPVVMMTALQDREQGRQALVAGAYDFITKPLSFERLTTVISVKLLLK